MFNNCVVWERSDLDKNIKSDIVGHGEFRIEINGVQPSTPVTNPASWYFFFFLYCSVLDCLSQHFTPEKLLNNSTPRGTPAKNNYT